MTLQRLEHTGNAPTTGLSAPISSGATSFVALAGTGYPTGNVGPFVICIDQGTATEEKILCSARSSATFTVASSGRGWDGTTAESHSAGTTNISHVFTAAEADDANDHVYTPTRDDHTQYARTDGTRAVTGNQHFSAGITVTGATSYTGNMTITGSLSVSTSATVGAALSVTAGITGATLTISGLATLQANATVAGTLGVTGTATLSGAATVGTTLGVTGAATLSSTLNVTRTATFAAGVTVGTTLGVTGNTTIGGTLAVTGTTAHTGAVSGPSFAANLTGTSGRFVGVLTSLGSPASGTYLTGDFCVDSIGVFWYCTAGGTPGTWVTAPGLLNKPLGRIHSTTVQNVTGGNTLIQCNVNDILDGGFTVSSNGLVAPVTGVYRVYGQWWGNIAATNSAYALIIVNGVNASSGPQVWAHDSQTYGMSVYDLVSATAGQIIALYGFASAATPVNVTSAAGTQPVLCAELAYQTAG